MDAGSGAAPSSGEGAALQKLRARFVSEALSARDRIRAYEAQRVDHFASAVADELRTGRLVIIEIKTVNAVGHALTPLGFRMERKLDGTFTAIVAFTDVSDGGARGNTIEAELFYGSPNADEDGETPKVSLSLKLLGGFPGHKIASTGDTACGAPKDDVLRKVLAPLAAAAPDA